MYRLGLSSRAMRHARRRRISHTAHAIVLCGYARLERASSWLRVIVSAHVVMIASVAAAVDLGGADRRSPGPRWRVSDGGHLGRSRRLVDRRPVGESVKSVVPVMGVPPRGRGFPRVLVRAADGAWPRGVGLVAGPARGYGLVMGNRRDRCGAWAVAKTATEAEYVVSGAIELKSQTGRQTRRRASQYSRRERAPRDDIGRHPLAEAGTERLSVLMKVVDIDSMVIGEVPPLSSCWQGAQQAAVAGPG